MLKISFTFALNIIKKQMKKFNILDQILSNFTGTMHERIFNTFISKLDESIAIPILEDVAREYCVNLNDNIGYEELKQRLKWFCEDNSLTFEENVSIIKSRQFTYVSISKISREKLNTFLEYLPIKHYSVFERDKTFEICVTLF